jgi:hypothetical protein
MKLQEWLEEHNARRLWQAPVKGVGTVTAWNVNGRVVLVLEYNDGRSWELFTALDTVDIVATFIDAEKRVGFDV